MSILIRCLPQRPMNALAHCLANNKVSWIKNLLIRYFLSQYSINLEEALEPNPYRYASFNDFFTRALKPGARAFPQTSDHPMSPADGCISQVGLIQNNRLVQAKGHDFSLVDLVGGDVEAATAFAQGSFATVYLAPQDYHRVHMPLEGRLNKMTYVPGQLFPVNFRSANSVPNLFARNERIIAFFDTPQGKMALVLVGAMIVGSIETVWSGTLQRQPLTSWEYTNVSLNVGEEMGRFKLGSTVIVLLENPVDWKLNTRDCVQVGQLLGEFMPKTNDFIKTSTL